MHIARYQSRYKTYKTSNHSIESSCIRPEAQQGLPNIFKVQHKVCRVFLRAYNAWTLKSMPQN